VRGDARLEADRPELIGLAPVVPPTPLAPPTPREMLNPETLAKFDAAFTPEMARYLSPAAGIETRELPGGTGPKAVAAALVEAENRLKAMRA